MTRVATSADWIAAAEAALEDKTRTDREKQQRHDYYMERAEQAKRAEAIRIPTNVPWCHRKRKPHSA